MLVDTLGLKPLLGPVVEIKSLIRIALVVSLLHGSNEVWQLSVLPGKTLEVELNTLAESFPAHKEDQLLDQTRSLTVGDAVDEGLSGVRGGAVSLDLVIRWHQIFGQTPSLVA